MFNQTIQGCVELHFLISTTVAKHIYPVSSTVQTTLSGMRVKVLSLLVDCDMSKCMVVRLNPAGRASRNIFVI